MPDAQILIKRSSGVNTVQMNEKYRGVIPAFYACYDEAGAVSPARVRALTEHLIGKGIKGVYVCGSSGECIYQSVAERKLVLENVMAQAEGRLTVIAHVACNNTADSVELARHADADTPGEAKHHANMWLLRKIYDEVRKINPQAVIGIRAFRQPPLEKDPKFLKECVDSMPKDIMLFWAPGLYVPETEFEKWCDAFGRERIWARDTESNSITSTMGRLYRTFKSNVIRYEDETNEQVIETDIQQHKGSVKMGVHGINGFMFEWYGLFMHLFAHGNYGWGSDMDEEEFYHRACRQNFGDLGETVLYVMRNIVTIHESQIPLYSTPFPFQKNKMTKDDIPTIMAAKQNHGNILAKIHMLQKEAYLNPRLRPWIPHFDKLENAERRNAVIYDMVLAAIAYEEEEDEKRRNHLLDEILFYNEKDFDIAKEMFFDINPVTETGVGSCMFPYHEMKRLIYNIRHPEAPDENVISSGVEAFGWLWL